MAEIQLISGYDKMIGLNPDEDMTLALVNALRDLLVQNRSEGVGNESIHAYIEKLVNSESYKTAMEKTLTTETLPVMTEADL